MYYLTRRKIRCKGAGLPATQKMMKASSSLRMSLAGLAFLVIGSNQPTRAFDHSYTVYGDVLQEHVHDGNVHYAAIKENPEPLRRFLREAAGVSSGEFRTWSEDQQLAFLINLYNAQTIDLIIRHYPLSSIRDIGTLLIGPWGQKVVNMFGYITTLDALEHKFIRVNYNVPEIHFALVCAAKGCPPLRSKPFTAEQLSDQLYDQGRLFLKQSGKNSIHPTSKTLNLSPIFKWYRKDFEKAAGSVMAYIERFLPDEQIDELRRNHYTIRYTTYDWSLNDYTTGED